MSVAVVFDLELERYKKDLRLAERETQRVARQISRATSQGNSFRVDPRGIRDFSAEAGEALRRVGLLTTELRQLSQIRVGGIGLSTARIDPERVQRLAQGLVEARERSAQLRTALRRTVAVVRELGGSLGQVAPGVREINSLATRLRIAENAARRLSQQVNRLGAGGGPARVNRKIRQVNTSLQIGNRLASQLQGTLIAAFSVAGAAAIGRATIGAADALQRQVDALALVAGGQENAARLQQELFFLAQDTRAEFDDTVESYARLARSTEDLAATESDRLTVTRTINQALQIGSRGVQEAAAAQVQLSQGLASNRLSGDELRSVLENAPRLAIAIADGLGVGIGRLRELGEAGSLTTEVVFEALQSQAEVINREFQSTTVRVEQAVVRVGNALQRAFGTGDVTPLTESLGELTDILQEPETVEQLGQITSAIAQIAALATDQLPDVIEAFSELSVFVTNIATAFEGFSDQIDGVSRLFDEFERFENVANPFAGALENVRIFNRLFANTETGVRESAERQLQAIEENLEAQRIAQKQAEIDKVLAAEDAAKGIIAVEGQTTLERAQLVKQAAKDAIREEKRAARERIRVRRDAGNQIERLERELVDRTARAQASADAELARTDQRGFAFEQFRRLRAAEAALNTAQAAGRAGDTEGERRALENARALADGISEAAESVEDLTFKRQLAKRSEEIFQEATEGSISALEKIRDGVDAIPDDKTITVNLETAQAEAQIRQLREQLATLGVDPRTGALVGQQTAVGNLPEAAPAQLPRVRRLIGDAPQTPALLPRIPRISAVPADTPTTAERVAVEFQFEAADTVTLTGTPEAADGLKNALGTGALKFGRQVAP